MKKFVLKSLLFTSISIISIIVVSYSQKYLYRILPSDYNRHAVIMDVLDGELTQENIIVFGGSQVMFGVDTRIIRDKLNYEGEIYNLSSVGQDLYESSYFYSMVNSKTETVIQCVTPSFFVKNNEHYLIDNKAISMFLSGYRINDATKNLINNYNRFFDQQIIKNYFEARIYFRSYFHNLLRPVFDNEQFDESVWKSLYFPHIYTEDKHPNYPVYEYNCDKYITKEIPVAQLLFLSKVNEFFQKRGVIYVLIFMPVNPDECNECYKGFDLCKRLIEEKTNIEVIDLSDLILDTNLFYDAYHPNKNGANFISSEIANQLKSLIDTR